ncbi:glycoside hydrolase 15 protein, partial [Phlyctochytrium planicorne]
SPPCADAFLAPPTEDSFYRGTFNLPDGYYEYKVAIDGSWNENYGANGVSFGPNIPLYVPRTGNVTFYWDSNSKWMFDSESSPFYYLVGSIQTALGCKKADNLDCLAGQFTDFAGTGTLATSAKNVAAGTYTVAVYHTSSITTDKVAATPITITVPADGSSVNFGIRNGQLTVEVVNGQTYTSAVKPLPSRADEPDTPVGVPGPDGCLRFPRQHFIKDPVQLGTYQYRGNQLYGEIRLRNLGFQKNVQVIYKDKKGDFTNSCKAVYGSGPYQSNFETWKFNCLIPAAGIEQLYVKYTAGGNDYYDSNGAFNYNVTQEKPWKFTKGFQRDISHFFQRNMPRAARYMLENISPAGTNRGVVVAAPKKQARNQNYFYHWIRDASLTMDVVRELYKRGDKSLERSLLEHAAFTYKIQNIDAQTGLGEAKYEVNGTDYLGSWCRPQNDGPGFRASLFIRFAKDYLAQGGDASLVRALYDSATQGVIKPDLDYVSSNFLDFKTCDLWEEQSGQHFFTLLAMRRAMQEGAEFATFMNDTQSALRYDDAKKGLDVVVAGHWDEEFKTVRSTKDGRQLDAAIPLGVIHGYSNDGVFAPNDDKVLNSLYTFALGMMTEYRLNLNTYLDNHDGPMGVAIGRYYGDHYDGVLTNGLGNPWFISNSAYAELYYNAAKLYFDEGKIAVTELNYPFFSGPRPMGLALPVKVGDVYLKGSKEFTAVVDAFIAVADSNMRRVRFHADPDARFPEEFGRDCGDAYGVNDLTWSYAGVLSAGFAREQIWNVWKKKEDLDF